MGLWKCAGALLLFVSACTIESRARLLDAYTPPARDAGAVVDAGDAGAACADGACPAGRFCNADGLCQAIPIDCAESADCAPSYACIPITTTSTQGRCRLVDSSCTRDVDCGTLERCGPAGHCLPLLTENGGLACDEQADCRPFEVCRDGTCGACDQRFGCSRNLACSEGRCVEAELCLDERQCYEGNACDGNLRECVRAPVSCESDPSNDTSAGATELRPLFQEGTICGEDVDWYTFTLEAFEGARLVVTSSRASAAIRATLSRADGGVLDTVGAFVSPEITIIEIGAANDAQDLLLEVRSEDIAGGYAIDLRLIANHCAGDRFDVWGDDDPETAPLASENFTEARRACPRDRDLLRIPIGMDDRIGAELSFARASGAAIDLVLSEIDGTLVAAGTSTTATRYRVGATRAAEATTWVLAVDVERAPTAGAVYSTELERERGVRRRACTQPLVIAGVESVSLSGAEDVGRPRCDRWSAAERPDRLFRIEPPINSRVLRAVARPAMGTSPSLSLALLLECGSDGSALVCDRSPDPGRPAALERVLTGNDPLFLMVSSDTATASFTLEVDFDAADNFTCRTDAAAFLSVSTTQLVSTFAATNTVEATAESRCGGQGFGAGPDRFYNLTVLPQSRVLVRLEGPEGGLLWASQECERFSERCVASQSIQGGAPAQIVLQTVAEERFLIAVDGAGAEDAGDYVLTTRFNPQCIGDADCAGLQRRCDPFLFTCTSTAPVNDRCPGTAVPLRIGERRRVLATTHTARDDFAHFCGTTPATLGRMIPDVVYSVEVPQGAASLIAEVTAANFDPVLAIRRAPCDSSGGEEACNDDQSAGNTLPLARIDSPRPGTYYVIVDAFIGSGPFTLELELR